MPSLMTKPSCSWFDSRTSPLLMILTLLPIRAFLSMMALRTWVLAPVIQQHVKSAHSVLVTCIKVSLRGTDLIAAMCTYCQLAMHVLCMHLCERDVDQGTGKVPDCLYKIKRLLTELKQQSGIFAHSCMRECQAGCETSLKVDLQSIMCLRASVSFQFQQASSKQASRHSVGQLLTPLNILRGQHTLKEHTLCHQQTWQAGRAALALRAGSQKQLKGMHSEPQPSTRHMVGRQPGTARACTVNPRHHMVGRKS